MKYKRITVVVDDRYGEDETDALMEEIKKLCDYGHSFDVVVDPGNPKYEKTFAYDGDGDARVNSILVSEFDDEKGKKPAKDDCCCTPDDKAANCSTASFVNRYLKRVDPSVALDKAPTRDRNGLFDDTRRSYTGEALLSILSIITNYGCLPWDRMDDREKQEFKDAQRAAGDYVHSVSKEHLLKPWEFHYRNRKK